MFGQWSPAARGSVMGSITYYVAMGFERSEEGDLVAMDPIESQSSSQAASGTRVLAATKGGVVAFYRTGDPDIVEFADAVVLFTAGEVEDELPTGWDARGELSPAGVTRAWPHQIVL